MRCQSVLTLLTSAWELQRALHQPTQCKAEEAEQSPLAAAVFCACFCEPAFLALK